MIVFVITQILLFWFAYRYQHKEGRKATFYAHNNRLELIWTIIPAIALTVLVLNGFSMWSKITDKAPEEAHQIEVFAYQFGWKVRYPGKDGILGKSNFNLISGSNELGLAEKNEYAKIIEEAKATLAEAEAEHEFLNRNDDPTPSEAAAIAENKVKLKRAQGHYNRLLALDGNPRIFDGTGNDDIIPTEIHIPIDEPVLMHFRARDVIHSAYMPYFRVQMNCVPGMPTQFWFKPTKTTAQIRTEMNDPNFDYYLICAKICGSAHFNMKIKVVVESKENYSKWLAAQKPRFNSATPVSAEVETPTKAIVSN
jgi:cytochrome c oxidase subunit 2